MPCDEILEQGRERLLAILLRQRVGDVSGDGLGTPAANGQADSGELFGGQRDRDLRGSHTPIIPVTLGDARPVSVPKPETALPQVEE